MKNKRFKPIKLLHLLWILPALLLLTVFALAYLYLLRYRRRRGDSY